MQHESFEVSESSDFGDLLNKKPPKRTLKIGVYMSAYFEYFRMYPESLERYVKEDVDTVWEHLRKNFRDNETSDDKEENAAETDVKFVWPGIVVTMDDADRAGREFKREHTDMIIFIMFTYTVDVISLQCLKYVENQPLIIFQRQHHWDIDFDSDYEQTLRNSAMISASQLTGTFKKINKFPLMKVFVGTDDEDPVYESMYRYAKAYETYLALKDMNIGIIGHVFRGMFDHEFDRTRVFGTLGPQVIDIQISHLLSLWEKVSEPEITSFAERNKWMRGYPFSDVTEQDFLKECRFALAYERLIEKFNLDAACYLGQHFVEKKTGCTGNLSNVFFARQKALMTNTEGDINGLIMMTIMNRLTGQTPLFGEWGEFGIRENAMQIMMHGYADVDYARDTGDIRITGTPENWGFSGAGFSLEFTAKPGTITIGHFIDDQKEGWRMLISRAVALDVPHSIPCKDVTLILQPEMPIKEYITEILERGFDHHAIICYGDLTRELGYIADFMGVKKDIL